ncbi:MAG TPA: hypothetical protein VKB93_06370 [Thermoanaerobaculia bacterium]|nr:hypothetical protein [Thermoanaerobaculia bacterium]
MSGNNDLLTKIKGTSGLERARFGPGMLLRHDDLEQLNIYPRELSRLLFRSLFGCGVVCGLVVPPPEDKCDRIWIQVRSGLALDCSGNPIHVPKDTEPFSFDPAKCKDNRVYVVLCGTVTGCSPRTSACASDDEESSPAPSREKDGYEIRIVRDLRGCICACLEEPATEPAQNPATGVPAREDKCLCVDPTLKCYQAHYAGKCCDDVDNGKGNDCGCCCDCVLLARLDKSDNGKWTVSHGVRRFVRPVLMRDPVAAQERKQAADKKLEEEQKAEEERKKVEKEVAEKVAAAKAEAERIAKEKTRSAKSRSSK